MALQPPIATALSRSSASLPELCARYLEEYEAKIRSAVSRLDEETVWRRSGPRSNAVGNLLLHLAGNLSLWVLEGLGKEEYQRHRDAEFAVQEGSGKDELLDLLSSVVRRSARVIRRLEHGDLRLRRRIQGYDTDTLGALFHAVEHMSYHTGQIVLLVKQLHPANRLEFYPQHLGE